MLLLLSSSREADLMLLLLSSSREADLRILLFDSWFDRWQGAVTLVQVRPPESWHLAPPDT